MRMDWTECTDVPDFLEALEVVAQLGVHHVGGGLRGLARLPVALPVEEPVGDLEGLGVRHNGDHLLQLLLRQLAGAGHVG